MENPCHSYYKGLSVKCTAIVDESFSSELLEEIVQANHFIEDMLSWERALSGRAEAVLISEAIIEYRYSLLQALQGKYRGAFVSLRFFLEQCLKSIYLSSNELWLRLWMRNERDISWKTVVDDEGGIFSKAFLRAFFPEIEEEGGEFRALAAKVYRETSEIVHGNKIDHVLLPVSLEFSRDVLSGWLKKATVVRYIVTFALSARYLCWLNGDEKLLVERAVLDELSFLEEIRNLY